MPGSGARELYRVLMLQGGGALGSYQAGVYEALADHGLCPHWIAGISIGAINAALIAGNPPDRQVDRLREFWTLVSNGPQAPAWGIGGKTRGLVSQVKAAGAVMFGVAGFFTPRFPPPQLQPPGTFDEDDHFKTLGVAPGPGEPARSRESMT